MSRRERVCEASSMAWDCETFQRRLERYDSGLMAENERRSAEIHLRDCEECRFLLAALGLAPEDPSAQRSDIAASVLEQTTGPSCARAISLLCDFTDELLDPLDRQLVATHLEHCADCAELSQALGELKVLLPELAVETPDSRFVSDVMAATTLKPRSARWIERLLDFFACQAQRPRFSWEAAYLATLLLVLLFGNPFSAFRDAPQLKAAFGDGKGVIAQASGKVGEWREDAERGLSAVEAVSNRLQDAARTSGAAVSGLTSRTSQRYQIVREEIRTAAHAVIARTKALYRKATKPER
jgi:hypothetical protein